MTNAIVPQGHGQLREIGQPQATGMTGCRIAGLALGALVLGIVLSQVPDIIHYIRISQM